MSKSEAAPPGTFVSINKQTGLLVDSPNGGKASPGGAVFCEGKEGSGCFYLAGNKGLAVVNISNPTEPIVGEKIDTGAICAASGIAMARLNGGGTGVDHVLYVAGGKGLQVFDVTDALKPSKVNDLIDTGAIHATGGVAMCLHGSTLYVAGTKGMAVYSIEKSVQVPEKIGDVIDTGVLGGTGGAALHAVKTTLFVAGSKGFAAFDISKPREPVKLSSVEIGVVGNQSGVDLAAGDSGRKMYVAGGGGLAVVDISDPKDLKKLGDTVTTGALAWVAGAAILMSGGKMLIAGGNGLVPISVADPAAPTLIKKHCSTGVLSDTGPAGMAEIGKTIYLAGGKGLAVVDKACFLGKA